MSRSLGLKILIPGLCLLFLLSSWVWAAETDEEMTREDLIVQLQALQERVALLEEQRAVGLTDEGRCGLAIDGTLRDETILKYRNTYGEWPNVQQIKVHFVEYEPSTGLTLIFYGEYWQDYWVVESWEDCTFVGSSDWWEEE